MGRRLRAVWCIVHGLGRAGEEYEISADGKIYETQAAATKQGATTVARICYVGNDAETNETYNHGLALALTDANNGDCSGAWYVTFNGGYFSHDFKERGGYQDNYVRSALAF